LLAAASIQGQEFDSRIVADVLGDDAAAVEDRLQGLDRVHAFVRRLLEKQLPDGSLSVVYRFAHALYQEGRSPGFEYRRSPLLPYLPRQRLPKLQAGPEQADIHRCDRTIYDHCDVLD
jgi:hypothetical protein